MKSTGIQIKGKWTIKDGKMTRVHTYRDASHAIRAKTSKRATVVTTQKAMTLPPGKPRKS